MAKTIVLTRCKESTNYAVFHTSDSFKGTTKDGGTASKLVVAAPIYVALPFVGKAKTVTITIGK